MGAESRGTWSGVGALTTAGTLAATIFCCLPFATGVIGAGVAAFGARVARFQPILATASLALLVHAFYRAYRPDPTCATEACALPSSVRHRRMILWIITVAVLAMLTTSWWASWLIYLTL
jgi:MerT mercuric transport protein